MKTRFDGLSEFISRRGRMKVLTILLEELKNPAEVAKRLNITRNAVYGWIKDKKRHPSNENAREMLKILNDENEKKIREILIDELHIFQKLVFDF
ncbi:hypothetical protein AKJ62_04070 [candidate division MSBL1 archaeon SCGC-AAA259D14]|uniref:HTH cro/C1-type domain-containing protein n=1 Tax=candidate division MSBL1 archaeon SCGC-AAA259D14 TaxID=1698261 RepID=A0A133U457_9EURY|nr:hypothetical protein AKJ62_04070 [candidate division MSBL1 archaeon SCGC-AAA259D14]